MTNGARCDFLVVPQSVGMATSQQLENRLSKPREDHHEHFQSIGYV
jgi:hypothetical protein